MKLSYHSFGILFIVIIIVMVVLFSVPDSLSAAGQTIEAETLILVNLHSQPLRIAPVIAVLEQKTHLVIEARNRQQDWLLVHTDSNIRGWILTKYVGFKTAIVIHKLPISTETNLSMVSGGNTTPINASSGITATGTVTPYHGDPLSFAAQITPSVRSAMQTIYAKGQAMGNNAHVFTRSGDCLSGGAWFLRLYGDGRSYDLGKYGYLRDVISYFSASPRPGVANSFLLISLSQQGGYTAASVQDTAWSDPKLCRAGETPLACEYRVDKPAIAFLMFGINDASNGYSVDQFAANLRQDVDQTLAAGIIPILSTAPESHNWIAKIKQYNQIVMAMAHEKNLPVIDLAGALSSFPDKGLDPDGIHLTPALNFVTADFNNLKDGFTVWNLLALQSLYNIRHDVMGAK